jgi:hypothetical protein
MSQVVIEVRRQAMAVLRSLLAAREPLYSVADHAVETSGRSIERIVHEITTLVGESE